MLKIVTLSFFVPALIFSMLFFSGCEKNNGAGAQREKAVEELYSKSDGNNREQSPDSGHYRLLNWPELIPAEYRNSKVKAKLREQLNQFQDGDPRAFDVFEKMLEEMRKAPVNSKLKGEEVRLAGFIAPLEMDAMGNVTEFLLVPYFGACIHSPPPPPNQIVLVKTAKGSGVRTADALDSISVAGKLKIFSEQTDLGEAGYLIENAKVYQ